MSEKGKAGERPLNEIIVAIRAVREAIKKREDAGEDMSRERDELVSIMIRTGAVDHPPDDVD